LSASDFKQPLRKSLNNLSRTDVVGVNTDQILPKHVATKEFRTLLRDAMYNAYHAIWLNTNRCGICKNLLILKISVQLLVA